MQTEMKQAEIADLPSATCEPVMERGQPGTVTQVITVERTLYLACIVLAAVLRIADLGAEPLTPLEANTAWTSWLTANGIQVTNTPITGSALYSSLQTFIFWLGANGDFAARVPAAVAGIILCGLPWWWRPVIGRTYALVATFLLAVDPWMLAFSRLGDGTVLSITLGAIFVTCCVWIGSLSSPVAGDRKNGSALSVGDIDEQDSDPTFLSNMIPVYRTAAVAFGLLLVSGPVAWNLLIPIVVSLLLIRRTILITLIQNRDNLQFMAGAAVLGATLWFSRLSGLGQVSHSLTIWLYQFRISSPDLGSSMLGNLAQVPMVHALERSSLSWVLLRLAVDQPLVSIFGLLGLAIMLRSSLLPARAGLRKTMIASGVWVVWGTLLILLPGRSAFSLTVIYFPLAIGTANVLSILWQQRPRLTDRREMVTVGLILLLLSTSCLFWLTALVAQDQFDTTVVQAAGTIMAVEIVLLVLFGYWTGRNAALWLACCWIGILLFGFQMSSSWKLNFDHAASHPDGLFVFVSSPEARLLRDDVQTLSAQRTGDPKAIEVQVQLGATIPMLTKPDAIFVPGPDPMIGWYLRDMQRLSWVLSPQVEMENARNSVAITPQVESQNDKISMALPDQFLGSNYQLRAAWRPNFFDKQALSELTNGTDQGSSVTFANRWAKQFQPLLRWIWYREANLEPVYDEVLLWATGENP